MELKLVAVGNDLGRLAEFKSLSSSGKTAEFFPYLTERYLCFLAGKAVARFALFENPHLKNTLIFGLWECENKAETARFVIDTMKSIAQSKNFDRILGPMNGSTWESYRFSLKSDFRPFFLDQSNFDFYPDQFKVNDFDVDATYFSTIETELNEWEVEKVNRLKEQLESRGIQERSIDLENYETEIEKIHRFSNEVFANNRHFSPIEFEDFARKYRPLEEIIQPEFCRLCVDDSDEIVALFFGIPDLLDPKKETLVVKTVARKPERIYAGTTHWLGNSVIHRSKQAGIQTFIHALMYEDNVSLNLSYKYRSEIFRRYELYQWKNNP